MLFVLAVNVKTTFAVFSVGLCINDFPWWKMEGLFPLTLAVSRKRRRVALWPRQLCNGFHRPLWWNGAKRSSAHWHYVVEVLNILPANSHTWDDDVTVSVCCAEWITSFCGSQWVWLLAKFVFKLLDLVCFLFRISNVFQRLECEIRWEINK